jgi:hypothetical protein
MNISSHCLILALGSLVAACSAGHTSPASKEDSSIYIIFKSNDANKDRCLSLAEWQKMAQSSTDSINNQADNLRQFKAWILDTFNEVDYDGNKCISVEEYTRFSRISRHDTSEN